MDSYERLVKRLEQSTPIQKGEVFGRAVRELVEKYDTSGMTNYNKRRWAAYDEEKALAKLTLPDKEARVGKGY